MRLLILTLLLCAACSPVPFVKKSDDGRIIHGDKVATDEFPNIPNSIYGGWESGVTLNSKTAPADAPQVYLNRSGKVVYSMACPFDDNVTLLSSITLDQSLNGNRVNVPQTLHSTYTDGSHRCTTEVSAGVLTFLLENGTLRVNHSGSADLYFNRQDY